MAGTASAQSTKAMIQNYLDGILPSESFSRSDVSDWTITSQHTSQPSGVTHVYIRQQYDGIPVANGLANFAIRDQQVMHMGNRLVRHLRDKARYISPALNPEEAIHAATRQLNIEPPQDLRLLELVSSREFIYSNGNISRENIPVRLMYHALSDTDVRLVWDLSIHTLDASHWWSVRVDARTGEMIFKNDWVLHCDFEDSPLTSCHHLHDRLVNAMPAVPSEAAGNAGQYAVFPLPAESPNHGARVTLFDPADIIASPYGWHDTDGADGPEFTITRGNNVYAYEDADDDNMPGYSPEGTGALNFIFPLNHGDHPSTYQDAAITHLFYMNNMMHDIWYQYGFDEASGNFQHNNYGQGGAPEDYVRAEALDGGGMNNANFATPPDGSRPRMQMYIWEAEKLVGNYFDILSPDSLSGPLVSTFASYGPGFLTTSITGEIALIEDHIAPSQDGCDSIINAEQLAGKFVMIDRGNCIFTDKTQAAQDAGAIGVIFVSTLDGLPTQVGGNATTITIPSIMISKADGDLLKAQLAKGTVTGRMHHDGTYDSGLDNGIIAHEYGHGISNRLTGGPDNTDCLSNAEQMGEGWSDWFGLMVTIEPGDQGSDIRGIGTYTKGQSTTGNGIRPAPYSTDFEVNPFTYGDSNREGEISQPHGVGFIFATALWDLNWALVDAYGGVPDPDIYAGTGGNNIAMTLVMEALKLQPCSPGMIDGRDAILLADRLLYQGAHQCLIWEVFARRGFGESASQGSNDSRTDQVEAFDIPTICQTATEPPVAAFSFANTLDCFSSIAFKDLSTSVPQSWFWDFGDGSTSTERHPSHTYATPGLYTVKLIVTNTIGTDSITQEIHPFAPPPAPSMPDVEVCAGDTAYVPASVNGTAVWRNRDLEIIHTGEVLFVPDVDSVHTYYVEVIVADTTEFVGPANGSIGDGGYHGTGYYGAVNFTAEQTCLIQSAWVNAQGAGPRTFTLALGSNTDGVEPGDSLVIQRVTLDLVDGPQRIDLEFTVPGPGAYNLGGSYSESAALYRNSNGATYPYNLPGFVTLTSSSANTDPLRYYYYLYDLAVKVRDVPCISERDTFTVAPVVSHFSYIGNGFTVECIDESVDAHTWFWDFGDGSTSILQHPVHTYDAPGDYEISLTINNGACTSSQTYSILTSVTPGSGLYQSMTLRPNPSTDFTNIVLREAATEHLRVSVTDLNGRVMRSLVILPGMKDIHVNASGLPAGLYIVRVAGGSFLGTRKWVVE